MAAEAGGPDFDWLTEAILYLETPVAPNANDHDASPDRDVRRVTADEIAGRISKLSKAEKRTLAAVVLQEGALRSAARGMDEHIRHARLSKRLVVLGLPDQRQLMTEPGWLPLGSRLIKGLLGLAPKPRAITEFHSLPAGSPLSHIWQYFRSIGADWASNARDERKAYMLACLSEIAYLYLTDRELEQDSRLRLYIPSRAGRLLHRHHARFTTQALQRAGDMGEISVIQSDRFAFFVLRIGEMAVITVAGTVMTDRRDWFADLDALKVAAPHGFYHRGFYDEAHDKLAELVDAVGDAKPLHITGHSLGAAMASILCSIWSSPAKPMIPYVFSSPRFGTKSVARRLPRYAYMKQGDLVTGLPPKWMGYSDEGAAMTIFPNIAAPGSGWQDQLWFRQKLRAHSIEQMRVTLASEIDDRAFGADCYTTQIAAEIRRLQIESDAL